MTQAVSMLVPLTLGGSAAVLGLALLSNSAWARYGARWRCWIWLLLCLHLAVPFPLMPQSQEAQTPIRLPAPTNPVIFETGPQAPPPVGSGSAQSTGAGTAGSQKPASPPAHDSQPVQRPQEKGVRLSLIQVLAIVWLAGAVCVLAWMLSQHLRFLDYLRRWSSSITQPEVVAAFNSLGDQLGLDRRPRLLACQGLPAPILVGMLRPALLLPQRRTSGEALGCALLHELIHYRRRDIWLKTLTLWVCALHWFNPLMWYMVRLVERDTELACDEAVLRSIPTSGYAAYGRAILEAVSQPGGGEEFEDQKGR